MVTRVEFRRQSEGGRLFSTDEERRAFLRRVSSLAERWQVAWLAYDLTPSGASLLVEGETPSLSQWMRLLQSGHGVWSYHRGDFLCWEPAMRVVLANRSLVLDAVCDLHRSEHGDPLSHRWCSLREAVGLRRAPWFDPDWLQNLATPQEHYLLAGGKAGLPQEREPWWYMDRPLSWQAINHAVASATGQNPGARVVRNLRTQVAFRCGWTVGALSEQLRVGRPAIRRALRLPPERDLYRSLLHLHDERLRPSIGGTEWAREATLQAC